MTRRRARMRTNLDTEGDHGMRIAGREVLGGIALVGLFVMIAIAMAFVARVGFLGVGIVGVLTWFVCVRLELEKDAAVGNVTTTGLYAQQIRARDGHDPSGEGGRAAGADGAAAVGALLQAARHRLDCHRLRDVCPLPDLVRDRSATGLPATGPAGRRRDRLPNARSRLLERDPGPATGRTPGLEAMDPASPGREPKRPIRPQRHHFCPDHAIEPPLLP